MSSAVAAVESSQVKTLLAGYGLKPLIPALAFFLLIFILHAHRRLLMLVGSFVPPDLVMYYMPGLRYISAGEWRHAWGAFGADYSVYDLRSFVEDRYERAMKKRRFYDYLNAFIMLKALALLNLFLVVIDQMHHRRVVGNLVLLILFFVAATVSVALHIYHERNNSKWAISEILKALRVKNSEKGHASATDEDRTRESLQADALVKSECSVRMYSFGVRLPMIGNLNVLKESLRDRDRFAPLGTGKMTDSEDRIRKRKSQAPRAGDNIDGSVGKDN
jgi:hypothetical protein